MKKRKLTCALSLALCFLLVGCSSGGPSASQAHTAGSTSKAMQEYGYDSPVTEEIISGDTAGEAEAYLTIEENRETDTEENSMLTFSLKVDTASYSNVERYLQNGMLPPADAVRTEELINYFSYGAPMPTPQRGEPFSLYTEVAPSPFDPEKTIAFIRVKTPEIDKEALPSSNLTFLIDTSGSMDSYDKLPLLKRAFSLLTDTLDEDDRVSIVTYAGSAGVVLDSAPGSDKDRILSALEDLMAGGSTGGAEGITTAYALAQKNFIQGGNNRVILATDGDFNVGPSSNEDLSRLIREKKDGGVYLSILGFGTGNIRDDLMETLSKDGNGNYAYINSLQTAQKVLVEELASSLFTVADDVKAQIEFNPAIVASYRQIGYENRALANEDFQDDTKDAGEIGVGTDVVALFELTLHGNKDTAALKYQNNEEQEEEASAPSAYSDELFEVRIRYKDPGEQESKLVTHPVKQESMVATGSNDLQFATAVSAFGQLLRNPGQDSPALGEILPVAEENLGADPGGYRSQFLTLLTSTDGLL